MDKKSKNPKTQRNRRLGPVVFNGENASTSFRGPLSSDSLEKNHALAPRIDTTRRSKKLRASGYQIWLLIGVLIFVLGTVLLSPLFASVGIAIFALATMSRSRNKSEQRVRREFFEAGEK